MKFFSLGKTGLWLALLATSFAATAVVIRHDKTDSQYQLSPAAFPALADFPGEGHGVLIAPQWVLTAAHVACMSDVQAVVIHSVTREVAEVIVHPGYRTLPDALVKAALASGDVTAVMAQLALSDDIALVRLKVPVDDVSPVPLYRGQDEQGRRAQLIGKGATATGLDGMAPDSPHRTELRRAYNVITAADARWLSYIFDAPPAGDALEGFSGKGDSGGPLLIEEQQQWQLAGIASWHFTQQLVDIRSYRVGRYSDGARNVRISRYVDWIEQVLAEEHQTASLDDTSAKQAARQ